MTAHIEVESQLNPRYLVTRDMSDYFGIYTVVRYEGSTRTVLKVFDDPNTDHRRAAYQYAGSLINNAPKESESK